MRYPASDTKTKHAKILAEASRLFREQGLSKVSIGDVMKAAALTHGSFYNHFTSKQALIADCIEHIRGLQVAKIEAAEASLAGKQEFVRAYTSLQARDNPGSGCLLSSLGPEMAREPAMRPQATRYVLDFIGHLVARFPWSHENAARHEAIRLMASVVGALVLARAVDDDELSREILREVAEQYGD